LEKGKKKKRKEGEIPAIPPLSKTTSFMVAKDVYDGTDEKKKKKGAT